jgi:nucleotide-binding universal stress UspA family protein
MMRIVVAVDGSASSGRAVEWCAAHAPALGAEVVAVHAVDQSLMYVSPYADIPPISEEAKAEMHDAAEREWCAALEKAGVEHRIVIRDGSPAEVVIAVSAAEEADLVVTGRRGRGGFAELLLGSTSHQLAHHLGRPLVIVP